MVYFYNGAGTQLSRLGWELDRAYLYDCGFTSYSIPVTANSYNNTWTVAKNLTFMELYVNDTHLATFNLSQPCALTLKGNVVSKVSFQFLSTVNGQWREKPYRKLTCYMRTLTDTFNRLNSDSFTTCYFTSRFT